METPNYLKEIILNPCFFSVLFTFQTWSGPVVAQDIALGPADSSAPSYYDFSEGKSASMNEVYPECPEPAGTLRFVYDDHELIRFMEEPKEGKFYYVVQLVYAQGQHESLTREVRNMKQFEIEYSRDAKPDEILVKRVCNLLEAPFIYHSDWVSVPIVHSSRTVGDSICANFNGAEVLFNPLDSSYTIVSNWENRSWTYYNVRFALNITYCNEEDTVLFITTFPYILTNNGTICSMTITLQYQGFTPQWYDCDEFNIFEDDPNAPVLTFCDGNHPDIEIQDSVLITTLNGEESFFIAGFEVTILKLTGSLSGYGVITLPFQNKSLLINFTNLNINQDLQFVSLGSGGSINAIVNGSIETPDGSLSLGGEMCIPPEESEWDGDTNKLTGELWDPNGFGKNGQYIKDPPYPGYQDGDPYDPDFDPCGFDAEGYYLDSGNKCNPEGCSRDSLTCEPPDQPCVLDCAPYFWLQENEVTQAGIEFYDSISGGLPGKVDSLFDLIQAEYESLLPLTQDTCNALASDMRGIVINEQLDSISIFGETSQYINPGLSTKFVGIPEKSSIRNQRNPNIVELEDLHVDLFHCDDRTLKLEAILEFIDSIGHGNPALLSFLEFKIKAFNADSVSKYSNPQAWLIKLNALIAQFLEMNYDGVDFGYLNTELPKGFMPEIFPSEVQPEFNIRNSNNLISFLGLAGYHTLQKYLSNEVLPSYVGIDAGTLPLEITLPIKGEEVKIIITNIGFGPTYLTVSAYLVYNLPNGGEQLIFSCTELKFSPNGFIDAPKLSLESDIHVKLFNVASLVLESDSTYVKWNCDGFEEMSIAGYIEFCNNILLPLDTITEEPLENSDEKVKAFFQTAITELDGFWAELTVQPFAVAGVKNVRFTITGAVLDMSTIRSPEELFPVGYTNENVQLNPNGIPYPTQLWKGFYLGHLGVEIIGGDLFGDNEISVDMYHAVVDDQGFSGKVNIGYDILELEDANIGGWAFSIDSFQLHFLSNHLVGAGFNGLIHVPIFKADCGGSIVDFDIEEEDCFEYGAQFVNGDEIQFSISPKSQMCVPLWSAKMVLDSNTVVNLRKSPDDFFLEAILYGEINFNNPTVTVQDTVRFENVRLRNKAPYFSVGNWDIPDIPVEIGPFKLTMKEIALDSVPNTDSKVRLSFIGGLEVEDKKFKIAAEASLSIFGDLVISNGRQRWVYDTTEVHGIRITTDIKGTHIEGGLRFFEGDTEYGKGFAGYLYTKFSKLGVTALSKGVFGRKNDFSYFNVDALASFPEGAKIILPMGLNGLGGGLSYNMAVTDTLEHLPLDMELEFDTTTIFNMPLGESLTGTEYIPDISKGLNVRLIVAGNIGEEAICSYNAVFEIKFSDTTFLEASLKGTVKMMDSLGLDDIPFFPKVDNFFSGIEFLNWDPPNVEAPVKGYFSIIFSSTPIPNLDGRIGVFIEAGPVQNRIIYGRALAELYIDQNKWYFNLGRLNDDPDGRAEFLLDVAILTTHVQGYLNIGTGIPPIPDPPQKIKELFGNIASPDASLGFGTGFAFGAAVDVELDIPIFIGSVYLNAGFGFDLSLKQYNNAICSNTGSEVGINGWYSTGQAYIYVNGNVKLFGAKLIDISTGAILQAGFPNPTWVSGQLKLRYKLLGVKGSLNAKLKYGSQCIPEGEEGSDLPPVIASVIPMNSSSKVDVLSSIHVDFNLPMETSEEYESGDTVIVYRTEIDTIKLVSGYGGEIPLTLSFDDEKRQLELLPLYTLPSGDSLTFKVRVRVFKNNVELTELDGLERIIGFKTQGGITAIPLSNISSTYPLDGMNNFYRDEYQDNLGYVNLVRNLYDLYHLPAGKHLVVVLSSPTQKFIGAATYDVNAKRISYPLPKSILDHNQFYKIELGLSSLDISAAKGILASITEEEYEMFNKLWSATFRVSSFESLFDKLAEMTTSMDLNVSLSEGEFFDHCTALPIIISEPFDKVEIVPYASPVLSDLNEDATLIEIKLDVAAMSTHSEYNGVWFWIDEVLKKYSDPFIGFFSYFFQQPARDRYEGLFESVFIGPDCNHDPEILHPEFTSQQFAALEGYAEMESNVDPNMIDDIGSLSGGELYPYYSNLAADQFLVINVNKYIKNLFLTGKSNASRAVSLAVARCLDEIGQGRAPRDAPQNCDEEELVGTSIYNLAFNPAEEPWIYPEVDSTIKIPIIITYTLPGTDHVTSTHNIIFTYTIE